MAETTSFDPTTLAVEYTDLNTGEKRMRLPEMAQMAWYSLVFPEGKISVTATLVKDYYVGHAKIYHNYMDPPECFLAGATAPRKYDPEKPTVSPGEWAHKPQLLALCSVMPVSRSSFMPPVMHLISWRWMNWVT